MVPQTKTFISEQYVMQLTAPVWIEELFINHCPSPLSLEASFSAKIIYSCVFKELLGLFSAQLGLKMHTYYSPHVKTSFPNTSDTSPSAFPSARHSLPPY